MEIVRNGLHLALKRGVQNVILRHASGRVTPGCELIVQSIDEEKPFTATGIPESLVVILKQVFPDVDSEITESVVLPPSGVRDGDGTQPGLDAQPDRT